MYVAPYFGHEKNVQAVSKNLPAVSLFIGPASVGKWQLAEHIRASKFDPADVLRIRRLTQENARFIAKFASERPKGSAHLVIARLDSKASTVAQNTILKTLEDAKDVHFILIAEEPPLPTIVSRATVFTFGLLSEEEIENILAVNKNYSEDRAKDLAKVAGGQVKNALKHSQEQDGKLVVIKALDALHRKDLQGLERIAPQWDQDHTDLLISWCYESLTNKWNKFHSEESLIVGTKIPLRILMALKTDLRPRLVVRAALASVLQSV